MSDQDWVPPPPGEGGGTVPAAGYEPPYPDWGSGPAGWPSGLGDGVPTSWTSAPGDAVPAGWPSGPGDGVPTSWTSGPAGRRVAADGTPITSFGARTAPWWRRVVAILLDGVLLLVVNQIVASVGQAGGAENFLRDVTSVALALLYYGYLNGAVGQTVGKMVMGIRTVDRDTGAPIGFGRGVARYAVVALLSLALVVPEIIDGLLPLRDPLRQSLHDKVVRSVVVDAR